MATSSKSFGIGFRFFSFTLSAAILTASAIASPAASAETVDVVLRLRERVPMSELAKAVTDPQSARFEEYFTPQEIRQQAGPSDEEYALLIEQLKNEGVSVVQETATHLFVTVRGDKGALERIASRSLPGFSTLVSAHGLTPSHQRHPHLKFLDRAQSRDGGGVQPDQIKQLYGFNAIYSAGITGKGQHIAVATYDGFYIQDIKDYYSKNGISPGPSVDQVTFNGTPTFNPLSAAETQTDAEFSGMIAPGASIHVFASAQNSDDGEVQLFTAILDDGRSKVVNYSWGSCEKDVTAAHRSAMDAVFARAVAQGVNILAASGDSGSDCEQDGSTVPDFPADSPNIVSVGGTTLSDDGSGHASETAWSGSGGGISAVYSKPSYQSGLDASVYPNRSYPDVAYNADPQSGQPTWVHYDPMTGGASANANYVVIGGTSIAAPQWSGFLALVGQARGAKALGFLNPKLYALSDSAHSSLFDDVTSGSNGAYTAAAGWDAVTGWGSMHASDLLNQLKK